MAGDRAIAALVKLNAGARFLVSIDTDGARKLKLKKEPSSCTWTR
jgi:hypothetical protein